MRFKEMKASERKRLIKDQEDLLTPMVQAENKVYEDSRCPRCDGIPTKELDIQRAIRSPRIIPRYLCRCLECGCLYDPHAGNLLIELGNRGRLEPEIPFHINIK